MQNQKIKNYDFWGLSLDDIFKNLKSSKDGLDSKEAEKKLMSYGYNDFKKQKFQILNIFFRQFKNPFIALLILSTIFAFFTGDKIEALIILIILAINSLVGFFQEYKAEKTFKLLNKYITHASRVLRDGKEVEINSKKIVPGDIIFFNIGDIIPADIRLIDIKNLTIDESALTGESFPVEKKVIVDTITNQKNPANAKHIVFMGTSVNSGKGYGIVFATGENTYFGQMAHYLQTKPIISNFQKNMFNFSALLLKVTILFSIFIFIINAFLGKGILDSALFALALYIGITPELLPIIITITLSKGALQMAKKKVIVRKLISIEDLGNMNLLCCDKTGTLTEGIFTVEKSIDIDDKEDDKVLLLGLLCSSFDITQEKKIFYNSMEEATWKAAQEKKILENYPHYKVIDKTEFDFDRRRISAIIQNSNEKILVAKGSTDSIINVCNQIMIDGQIKKITPEIADLVNKKILDYENQGYRLLAVAKKPTDLNNIQNEDEKDLTLFGFLIFFDPPKLTAKEALEKIKNLGIELKLITGDSPIVTKKVCEKLNFDIAENKIITGEMLENLTQDEQEKYYAKYNVFARITPEKKYRIVEFLNKKNVVGYLGDGINDAPALKIAEVGISVDSAVGIAKDAAEIVLLKKSLNVLADGIIEGRKAFGNTIKYILNITSANFGNMLTLAIWSFFLPFLPMLPSQILLTNLISDITLIAISTDYVDKEFLIKPSNWNIRLITWFMMWFGLFGALSDIFLMIPLNFIMHVPIETSRSCWFIFSTLSEILITFFIRTTKPFWQSRPSNKLLISGIFGGIFTILLPFTSFGFNFFKLVRIPTNIIFLIILLLIGYCFVVEIFKRYFFKKFHF